MENMLKDLLESDALDSEIKQSLKEAWETKLQEAREQVREEVETEVREEFARRFESDRGKMVDAMDKFMTEAIEKELSEFNDDRKAVYATRAKLAREIRETKEAKADAVKQASKVLEAFVLQMVNSELKEFMLDKQELAEEKAKVAKSLNEEKEAMEKVTADRINKLEKFVIKKLTEEIGEFETDKQELVEQKVRMAREAKKKLDETRKNFIERSAALVEKTLKESLTKEFTQFRDDIKVARENHFGRKLFEAFAAEYMTSYLSEGSEVKKLQNQLDESKAQTATAIEKLDEQQNLIRSLDRKIHLSEDKARRSEVMSELLSPLSRENREVMGEILANVKTERLREAFQKHLPAVLNESKKSGSRIINEERAPKKTVAITGNRETRVAEATEPEADTKQEPADVVRLRMLAGIK